MTQHARMTHARITQQHPRLRCWKLALTILRTAQRKILLGE
jgi:hypothetical protein